jgi:hypothetical protein
LEFTNLELAGGTELTAPVEKAVGVAPVEKADGKRSEEEGGRERAVESEAQ